MAHTTFTHATRAASISALLVGTLLLAPAATASARQWNDGYAENSAASTTVASGSVVDFAMSKVGSPYAWGGSGPDLFDCSGLVQWSYSMAGIAIPRTSGDQWAAGTPVSLDALEPGDIVVMYGGGHVGIYIGDGQIVHALNSSLPVEVDPMSYFPVDGAVRF